MDTIRWGLLGAGRLLDRWLKGFRQVEDAEIAGIASRTRETAEKQARKYGIKDAMIYDELLERKDIDVMYIPVPHPAHKELAIRAMEAGFPVLVEKPAAVTEADWNEMCACAEKNRAFLMEAVWTRFFPVIQKVLDEVRSGTIGEVRNVQAAFAYRIPDEYRGRLIDPEDAGGALLDVGVYNLHFARMVYGKSPLCWASLMSSDSDGMHIRVDEQAAYVGRYDDGALCMLSSAIRTEMPDTAWIYGTKGYIRIPTFWKASECEIVCGEERRILSEPVPQRISGIEDEGYQYEIRHVQDCFRRGLTESPLVPRAVTGEVLAQCDLLRKQWGLRYPFERK